MKKFQNFIKDQKQKNKLERIVRNAFIIQDHRVANVSKLIYNTDIILFRMSIHFLEDEEGFWQKKFEFRMEK